MTAWSRPFCGKGADRLPARSRSLGLLLVLLAALSVLLPSPYAHADEGAGLVVGVSVFAGSSPAAAPPCVSRAFLHDADSSSAPRLCGGSERAEASLAPFRESARYVYDATAQAARTTASRSTRFFAPQTPGGEDDCDPGGFW